MQEFAADSFHECLVVIPEFSLQLSCRKSLVRGDTQGTWKPYYPHVPVCLCFISISIYRCQSILFGGTSQFFMISHFRFNQLCNAWHLF